MELIKTNHQDSKEALLLDDYREAFHNDLPKYEHTLEKLWEQKKNKKQILEYLEVKNHLSKEECSVLYNSWKGYRKNIPNAKKDLELKNLGKDFEDRVWRLFYNMGADFLNTHTQDFEFDLSDYEELLPAKAQIDVLGIFQNKFIFICECASTNNKENGRALDEKIYKIESYKSAVKKRISKIFNKDLKLIPIWILSTEGFQGETRYKQQLLKNDIITLSDIELEYLENCYDSSKSSSFVFNQFLGFFKGNTNYWDEIEVTGFETSHGSFKNNTKVYTFSIKPSDMMKMSSVAHRKAKNIYETEGLREGHYQRVLTSGRLKSIGEFIDDKRESFKNNIMVSFRGKNANFVFQKNDRKGQGRGGILKIKICPGNFHVIDGQHRLYGYSAVKDKSILETSELIVTAFVNLSEPDEAQMFLDINSKQKKVGPALIREVRALKGYASKGKEKLENMATAITASLRDPEQSPFSKPSAIAETEPQRAGKLLTPLAFQNAIIEAKLVGIKDHLDGLCAETSKSDEDNYYKTIDNVEKLLLNFFNGVREASGKYWSEPNNSKNLNENGLVFNPFIGGLIMLLGRFIESANLFSKNTVFQAKKLDPYFEHLFNALRNMTSSQKDLFFGDRSKYRTETGRRYILALLVDEFFSGEQWKLKSAEDHTYLKRLEEENNKEKELQVLEKKLDEALKEINQQKDLGNAENKNRQAQSYEKYFKTAIHLFLQKSKGEDYSNSWLRKQRSHEAKKVLEEIRYRSDEALRNESLEPYSIDISWCNFPELRDLLLAVIKENNKKDALEVDRLFAIIPYENFVEKTNPKKIECFKWMDFLNVLRRFNDSGHTAAMGDIDPTNTELANNQFKYYDLELKNKIKLIEDAGLK